MKVRSFIGCVAVLLPTYFPFYGMAAGFVDPLDKPASVSQFASQTLILSVTQAGERLVAVGQRGHIVYSDDDGESWQQAAVPVSSDLTAVFFVNPTAGWAVGHGGVVLHTQDGGVSWSKQLDGRQANTLLIEDLEAKAAVGNASAKRLLAEAIFYQDAGPDKPFLGVWFTNENDGYVVGAYNLIFHTVDGGKHWQPWFDRTDNPSFLHLNAIEGVGDNVYIVGEQGLFLHLDAGAQRFVARPTPYTGSFFALSAAKGHLLVLGMRGNAFRSTNEGLTWSPVETGAHSGLSGSTTLDDGRIVLVSQGGQVLVSTDQGITFSALAGVRPMSFASVSRARGNGIAVGGMQGVRVEPLR